MGYAGVVTATSGNYGAAVASQPPNTALKQSSSRNATTPRRRPAGNHRKSAGLRGLWRRGRQLSVGPELFYKFLLLLEETGYFNASLYTPYSILGIETLGYEIVEDALRLTGRLPT